MYFIEKPQTEFWKKKHTEQSKSNDSLRIQMNNYIKKNYIILKKLRQLNEN